jgi:hypothetical protein
MLFSFNEIKDSVEIAFQKRYSCCLIYGTRHISHFYTLSVLLYFLNTALAVAGQAFRNFFVLLNRMWSVYV